MRDVVMAARLVITAMMIRKLNRVNVLARVIVIMVPFVRRGVRGSLENLLLNIPKCFSETRSMNDVIARVMPGSQAWRLRLNRGFMRVFDQNLRRLCAGRSG